LVLFMFLCVMRIFDKNTFLLVQSLVASLFLFLVLKLFSKKFHNYWLKDAFLYSAVVFFLLIFLVMNIDRSRSIHVYEQVHQATSANIYELDEIANYLKFTADEYTAFTQRINEQKDLGGFIIEGDSIRETKIGASIRLFSRQIARLANLSNYPKY
jgi:hypothetical protein